MATFQSIKELIRGLTNGDKLISDMFAKRKTVAIKYEDALETLDGEESKLQYLISFNIIERIGDTLELNDVYQQFFENVLQVNEEINVATVAQYIDILKNNINFYLASDNEKRKAAYLKEIRHTFMSIEQTTRRNVVDLKRNIDDTYKQEPDFKLKRLRLKVFDEKSSYISELIRQTERMMDEQTIFFKSAVDIALRQTITETKRSLIESAHGIINIQNQIVDYLNRIEYQNRIVKKVRQLKYLKDQFMLEESSDIESVLQGEDAVWMEKQPRYVTRVSLDFLRNDDAALSILEDLRQRLSRKAIAKTRMMGKISARYLQEETDERRVFNHQELINGFLAQSGDLFLYLWNYTFSIDTTREERLVLFLQLASQYDDAIRFTGEIKQYENIEYPIIIPK